MFDALQSLPDTWYVFHSFKIVNTDGGELQESECDFVLYNREKGIVCLEAKAGSGICDEIYDYGVAERKESVY